MKKEYIIPIFVPHLGCKKCCTFCNQRTISGEKKQVTAKDVTNTIEYYLKNFKNENNYVEVAFFGGSFTAIEREKQEELLSAVQPYIKEKKVDSIRLSTRPDAIDKDILRMLKKYNVKTIELGVQSTNNYILARCKRGHSFEDVKKASKLIRFYRFNLGHQMMVGLPDSTEKDDIQSAKDIIKLRPKMVRIYPVLVIKGTELEEEFNKGDFTPLTVGQAVERSKEIVKLFEQKRSAAGIFPYGASFLLLSISCKVGRADCRNDVSNTCYILLIHAQKTPLNPKRFRGVFYIILSIILQR